MLRGSVELSHQTRSAATGSRNLGNNVKEVWKGLGAAALWGKRILQQRRIPVMKTRRIG